ncbi:uncharacterized protein [Antedon mediterranea]|uniref:uncharacterized protein n=1 Tax=Antedon mediterranea TaxID=105859 RepID=UPI003AF702AF
MMDEDILKQYFTIKQFATMSDYEKKRHLNIKQNYEKMVEIGLEVPMPVFMRGPFHPKKRKITDSDDSDEEWRPGVDTITVKKKKLSSKFSAPFRTCRQTNAIKSNKRSQQCTVSECPSSSEKYDDKKGFDSYKANRKVIKKKGLESNRYPKRNENSLMVCYKESEIPDDDNFIYCEDCDELNEGQCPTHSLVIVNDKPTPDTCKDRAHLSLPDGLQIAPSKMKKAGLGVWTKTKFPKGVQFGPYGGEIVYGDEGYSGYAWQIHKDGKRSHFVDGQKENKSNWMRYVNCARNENEQNLVSFQYQSQIYYRTFKPILAHCELLVFYGQEYAQELKIDGVSCGAMLKNTNMRKVKNSYEKQENGNDSRVKSVHEKCIGRNNYSIKCRDVTKHCEVPGKNTTNIFHHKNNVIIKSNKIHTRERPYGCEHCGKKFNQNGDLKRHLRIHTEETPYECEHCGKKFTTNWSLKLHLRIHTGETPYECEHCGKKFNQNGHLKKHLRIHTEETPYECEHCGKRFNQSGTLKKHLRIHTGETPYECEHCGKRFNQSGTLKKHLRIHTGETPYECEHCGKRFNQSGTLKKHLRIHTGETPYECEHCGKKFNQNGDLKKHLRIHTGETPYECEHCGKKFNRNDNLKTHLRIHTGETPYECEHCGKKFNQNGHLKKHLRIHTGETPYECEHCGKKFNRNDNLKTHLRIHTGETPYECEHCGKKFNQNDNLKTHLRIHTGETPYEYEHCGKKFNQISILKTHFKSCAIINTKSIKKYSTKIPFKKEE